MRPDESLLWWRTNKSGEQIATPAPIEIQDWSSSAAVANELWRHKNKCPPARMIATSGGGGSCGAMIHLRHRQTNNLFGLRNGRPVGAVLKRVHRRASGSGGGGGGGCRLPFASPAALIGSQQRGGNSFIRPSDSNLISLLSRPMRGSSFRLRRWRRRRRRVVGAIRHKREIVLAGRPAVGQFGEPMLLNADGPSSALALLPAAREGAADELTNCSRRQPSAPSSPFI
jgi:hypothetical protein